MVVVVVVVVAMEEAVVMEEEAMEVVATEDGAEEEEEEVGMAEEEIGGTGGIVEGVLLGDMTTNTSVCEKCLVESNPPPLHTPPTFEKLSSSALLLCTEVFLFSTM